MRAFIAIGLLCLTALAAYGQHRHPPQDVQLHNNFYSNWLQPNHGRDRVQSCCGGHDCYPTRMRNVGGVWFAQRREDGAWIAVPPEKLEQNQADPVLAPDGRAHVCMSPPQVGNYLYCATLGSEG